MLNCTVTFSSLTDRYSYAEIETLTLEHIPDLLINLECRTVKCGMSRDSVRLACALYYVKQKCGIASFIKNSSLYKNN
jgi:hypothetical protein